MMKLSQLRRFLFMLIIKTVLSCFATVPFSLLKKYIIEKSCTKLKFTLILKEFRFVQRVVGVQRAKPLVAGQFDL